MNQDNVDDYRPSLRLQDASALGFDQLRETGLIGIIAGHVGEENALALVDALLAAPVLISAVKIDHPQAFDFLDDLARGTSGLMLVGAWLPQTTDTDLLSKMVDYALSAGARFFIVPYQACSSIDRLNVPYWPAISTLAEAERFVGYGGRLMQADVSVSECQRWRSRLPEAQIIVQGEPMIQAVANYKSSGALAIAAPLWDPAQSGTRPTIVKARAYASAWLDAS